MTIEALKARGNKVAVLNLPNVPNPIKVNGVVLKENTDQAISKAIIEVQRRFGKIGSFIHLHPHFEFQEGNFTQHFTEEKAIVKTLFFLAKHLQKDLNELGEIQRANFLTVTRMDGFLGQGKRGNTSVIGGGITGLVKCLNLEWSSVFCRAVDIQPEMNVYQMAKNVISELHDPNVKMIEVAVSEEGRKTTGVSPSMVKERIKTTVSKESVFLVSGGARGVTATCVIEMAKAFKCNFILLGRSSINFEIPPYAKGESKEKALKLLIMNDMKERGEKPSLTDVKRIYKNIVAKTEISETISQITAAGGQAIYIQGDVTNLASFKLDVNQAEKKLGKITGIIHGAGRLADKYIQDKTEADFENVLSVKLDGFLSLLSTVNLNKLDHLILFSSVAGFYGNVGQTDYAIANEILSKAAHLFKTNHPNTHVSAINWGAWDSGMVSGELKAQFQAAGINLVNSEGGAAMLVNELNADYANQPQCIIGGTLPAAVSHLGDLRTHRIERKLTLANNRFLQHHVIQGKPVLPVVNAVGWMAHSCESLYPDYRIFKIEDTKLYKGIVFDGNEKEDYVLEIQEVLKSKEELVFITRIFSEGNKLPTNHYKAKVTLVHKNSVPVAPTFKHKISGYFEPDKRFATDGALLYKDGTLFHDVYFQGIKEVLDCNTEQIVLSCKAPEVPLAIQGQFPIQSINTYFADIQYQGMLVWVAKIKKGAKSLPLQTDSAIIYKPAPFDQELFVNVSIQTATDVQMTAECTVYDAEGTVYMKTSGAVVTIARDLEW